MKHFVKNLYSFSGSSPVPLFIGQREEYLCPHCNKRVLIAVPTTGIDWERVANDYKRLNEKMWRDCNELLANEGISTILDKRLTDLMNKLKKGFNDPL